MLTIEVEKRDIDPKQYKLRKAMEEDYDQFITESCVIVDKSTKEIIAVYVEMDDDVSDVMRALDKIRFTKSVRSGGLQSTSRVFGYLPRNTLKSDFCTTTSLAREMPHEHAAICKYGITMGEKYSKYRPETYEAHRELMKEKVLDEYAMRDTPFTSGIINKNNELKYHFDSGNFKGVYSAMAVFKRDVSGGYLSMPEFGLGFELKHNSVFLFDGQEYLHGVTPIKQLSPQAARYTIVYYSMRQIWNCLPVSEEISRIRKKKTDRERARLQRLLDNAKPVDGFNLE
jgi:hypothetical protein